MYSYQYLYPDAHNRAEESKIDHFSDKVLSFSEVKNGYIVPVVPNGSIWSAGIYSENRELIPDTSLHSLLEKPDYFDAENADYMDETVIYFGLIYNIWGHCLTDELSRAWYIKYSQEYKERYTQCRIVCVSGDSKGFSSSFSDLLSILGIDTNKIKVITKPTKFSSIIIPDRCFTCASGAYCFTEEYRRMVKEIRDYANTQATDLSFNKVYFTYNNYKKRITIGERKLEEYFKEKGYKIIAPEKYSFYEQLNILANCTHFASTIGSCSHNTMFLSDSANIILIPRADYLGGYQQAIDELWNQNIVYVDSNLSVAVSKSHPWTGSFFYYISQELLDVFNENYFPDAHYWRKNFKDFKKYIKLGIMMNSEDEINPSLEYSKMCVEAMLKYRQNSCFNRAIIYIRNRLKSVLKSILHKS